MVNVMRLTWLADALRNGGLTVDETQVPDWKQRGHDTMVDVRYVMAHHTAGAARGNTPSLSGMASAGSAHLCLGRNGVWYPMAAGLTYGAGKGSGYGLPQNNANPYVINIEGESVGTRDDWTPQQRTSYPLGVAALLWHQGLGADRLIGHKEWAPTRKIDPAYWDMTAFREQVAAILAGKSPAASSAASPAPATVGAPPILPWPFPAGHYVGDIKGPAVSHGGYYASERGFVQNVQQWLVYKGCVSGVDAASWASSSWSDGKFEAPYSTNAARVFHDRFYPNQPYPEQIWSDDYQVLTRG